MKYRVNEAFIDGKFSGEEGGVFIPALGNFGADKTAKLVDDGTLTLITGTEEGENELVPADAPARSRKVAKKK